MERFPVRSGTGTADLPPVLPPAILVKLGSDESHYVFSWPARYSGYTELTLESDISTGNSGEYITANTGAAGGVGGCCPAGETL